MHRMGLFEWGGENGARKPYWSQQPPHAKSCEVSCQGAGPCVGHGRVVQRDRKSSPGVAFHWLWTGVASRRHRRSNLRACLEGGPAARCIEGDLEQIVQGERGSIGASRRRRKRLGDGVNKNPFAPLRRERTSSSAKRATGSRPRADPRPGRSAAVLPARRLPCCRTRRPPAWRSSARLARCVDW